MAQRRSLMTIAATTVLLAGSVVMGQQVGSIRGVVYDQDFDAPLALAEITIAETGQTVTASAQGDYVFPEVPPGTYTLVFIKDGYARRVRSNVLVTAGQLTDIDARLSGEFVELEEFVVQDLQVGGGTEAGLLRLRLESPALLDSISADLLSQAGASDAASALNFVSGATVQDGKFAVIRGLPDRYVSSQINGIRLPTADEEKRAVQLDQFPSAVIESVQISKTFTPDQQGDASGGAVDVVLKGIPKETIFSFKAQYGYNSQVQERDDFLTYTGGGVNTFGDDRGGRDIPEVVVDDLGRNIYPFGGAVGTSRGNAPTDYKFQLDAGGSYEFDNDVRVGGFASFFYERDSSFHDNGIDDSYWVTTPGEGLVPETSQGTPQEGTFLTSLFDVTEASQSVQWGTLGTFGIANDNHEINLVYLYTRIAEDTATLAEDTRGKQFFFPGYDPSDLGSPGAGLNDQDAAPYIRTETLAYNERATETVQLRGEHTLPLAGFEINEAFKVLEPEFDWSVSNSRASFYEPDKRQFGEVWEAEALNPGFPPFFPPFVEPPRHRQLQPAETFTLGNFQRIYKEIVEENDQIAANLKIPFEQWSGVEGYMKFGIFDDSLTRSFKQDTFSNFNDITREYIAPFEDKWSEAWNSQPGHDIQAAEDVSDVDVDYDGRQDISAWYLMADVPVTRWLNVIGGARFEQTLLETEVFPGEDATYFPPGEIQDVRLTPGVADAFYKREDILPSIGFVWAPLSTVTVRGSYSETIARQTFRELSPVLQQEFLGGDVFVGNPELEASDVTNYDLRVDYTPFAGGLFSISYFDKDIEKPIETVQRVATFVFTTPVNFPSGTIQGWEFEARQDLGQLWQPLTGLTVGANATLIDSEVLLSEEESEQFDNPSVLAPQTTRDASNAPEHLYNLYFTYDVPKIGTELSLFYTVRGDTLIAGAGVSDGNFVPSIYETEFDTLNFTLTQNIGDNLSIRFQAKNLTNPAIEEVYRSVYIGDDVVKTSYTKGVDYSVSVSADFTF